MKKSIGQPFAGSRRTTEIVISATILVWTLLAFPVLVALFSQADGLSTGPGESILAMPFYEEIWRGFLPVIGYIHLALAPALGYLGARKREESTVRLGEWWKRTRWCCGLGLGLLGVTWLDSAVAEAMPNAHAKWVAVHEFIAPFAYVCIAIVVAWFVVFRIAVPFTRGFNKGLRGAISTIDLKPPRRRNSPERPRTRA